MPYRIGLLAYPLFLLVTLRNRSSASAKFIAAGATSPETARRPESLGISPTLNLIKSAVRTGVLVPVGDKRYYVDLARHKRRTRRQVGTMAAGSAAFALALTLLLLHPWS